MARISPISQSNLQPAVKVAFERHLQHYEGGITNTKATLGHSLLAFEVYMQWYPMYQEVERILGQQLARRYAYTISSASDCALCTAFFRKLIVESGESLENNGLGPLERNVIELGCSIARYHGNIANHVYNAVASTYSKSDMVILVAFAGQMIATNVFNNVIETEIDDYLVQYLPTLRY